MDKTSPLNQSGSLSMKKFSSKMDRKRGSTPLDLDTKVVLHARLSWHRGRDPAEEFLDKLKEKHRVSDAEFLVNGMGYLTALARTNLSGDLNYTERNIVEKLFQTSTMRIQRFHENLERQSGQR